VSNELKAAVAGATTLQELIARLNPAWGLYDACIARLKDVLVDESAIFPNDDPRKVAAQRAYNVIESSMTHAHVHKRATERLTAELRDTADESQHSLTAIADRIRGLFDGSGKNTVRSRLPGVVGEVYEIDVDGNLLIATKANEDGETNGALRLARYENMLELIAHPTDVNVYILRERRAQVNDAGVALEGLKNLAGPVLDSGIPEALIMFTVTYNLIDGIANAGDEANQQFRVDPGY